MKEVNKYGASTTIDEPVLAKTFTRVWPDIDYRLAESDQPVGELLVNAKLCLGIDF
jgi:hypothetical protein